MSQYKRLRLETLEDRWMRTLTADVVFLLDESLTSSNGTDSAAGFAQVQSWLANHVGEIDRYLREDAGISDLRYGVVGFGGDPSGNNVAEDFGHSYVLSNGTGIPVNGRLLSEGAPSVQLQQVEDVLVDIGANRIDCDGEDAKGCRTPRTHVTTTLW